MNILKTKHECGEKKTVTDKTEWTLPKFERIADNPLYMDIPQYVYLFIC